LPRSESRFASSAAEVLKKLFSAVRVISRRESDAKMEMVLKPFPFCYEYRAMHPLALKIFDVHHFCEAERFFVFDSDILFFNHPRALVDWADEDSDTCWLAEGFEEHSLLGAVAAKTELNVKILPFADAGMCLMQKSAIDLDFLDAAFAQTSILRGSLERATETALMLCAAKTGHGGLLPKQYEVSRNRRAAEDAFSRHYAGAERGRFAEEAMRRVTPHLFAQIEEGKK